MAFVCAADSSIVNCTKRLRVSSSKASGEVVVSTITTGP
jgi:hypothetical protein